MAINWDKPDKRKPDIAKSVAQPVIKRVHRRGPASDPIRGLYGVGDDLQCRVVQYDPDSELRDTEQFSLEVDSDEGGKQANR